MPSTQVCSNLELPAFPQLLNQEPPKAQQVRMPVFLMVPHSGQAEVPESPEGGGGGGGGGGAAPAGIGVCVSVTTFSYKYTQTLSHSLTHSHAQCGLIN